MAGRLEHRMQLRVRYSETDQLGTFYNSRALEWFEVARSEVMRAHGMPYVGWEKQGFMLPLVEAHVSYRGRAKYDDLLDVSVGMEMSGRASVRFEVKVTQAEGGAAVCQGYTTHAITNAEGRAVRPPAWLVEKMSR